MIKCSEITLRTGCVWGWRSGVQVTRRRHVGWRSIELVISPGHLDGSEHRLSKIDCPTVFENHLEANSTLETAVLLGLNESFDEIRPKDRLFNFYVGQRHERGAKRHHSLGWLFIVKNHAMCRQVDPSCLLSFKLGPILTVEIHGYIVAEEQDSETQLKDFSWEISFSCI